MPWVSLTPCHCMAGFTWPNLLEIGLSFLPDWQIHLIFVQFSSNFLCMCCQLERKAAHQHSWIDLTLVTSLQDFNEKEQILKLFTVHCLKQETLLWQESGTWNWFDTTMYFASCYLPKWQPTQMLSWVNHTTLDQRVTLYTQYNTTICPNYLSKLWNNGI